MSGLVFKYELSIVLCCITAIVAIVHPLSYIIADAETTATSSSIKDTIDKVVSDTLNGMMEDTVNKLIKNTSQLSAVEKNTSNLGFQNKLPSSVDLTQITNNTTKNHPKTEQFETNNTMNKDGTNQSANSSLAKDALINSQNETAQSNRTDSGLAVTRDQGNPPLFESNNGSPENTNDQSSHHDKPANFIADLIYKFRQLFFK